MSVFLKFNKSLVRWTLSSFTIFWFTLVGAGVDQGNPNASYKNKTFKFEFTYNANEYSVDDTEDNSVKILNSHSDVALTIKSIRTTIKTPAEISAVVDVQNCEKTTLNLLEGYKCHDRFVLLTPQQAIFVLSFSNDQNIQAVIKSFAVSVRMPHEFTMSTNGRYLALRGETPNLKHTLIEIRDRSTFNKYSITSKERVITDSKGTLRFLSNEKLLISNFNGNEFEIINVATQKTICSQVGITKAQAILSSDNLLVGVVTKNSIGVYNTSDCSLINKIPWDIGEKNVAYDLRPIAIDTKTKEFIFWSNIRAYKNDANGLHKFSYESGKLTTIPNVVDGASNDFLRVVNRPGTTEAWFYAIATKSNKRWLQIVDYKTAETKLISHKILGSGTFFSGYDFQFSKDGSKFVVANGWDLGIYNSIDLKPIRLIVEVGCVINRRQSCDMWEAMTALFEKDRNEVIFAGERGLNVVKF